MSRYERYSRRWCKFNTRVKFVAQDKNRRTSVNNPALKGEACEEPHIDRLSGNYVRIVITPLGAPPAHRSSLAL